LRLVFPAESSPVGSADAHPPVATQLQRDPLPGEPRLHVSRYQRPPEQLDVIEVNLHDRLDPDLDGRTLHGQPLRTQDDVPPGNERRLVHTARRGNGLGHHRVVLVENPNLRALFPRRHLARQPHRVAPPDEVGIGFERDGSGTGILRPRRRHQRRKQRERNGNDHEPANHLSSVLFPAR
jgi:hypothetical protein